MTLRSWLFAASLLAGWMTSARAADIAVEYFEGKTFSDIADPKPHLEKTIRVTRNIFPGDETRFAELLAKRLVVNNVEATEPATVYLHSGGGNVLTAIRIADLIRSSHSETEVAAYEDCFSACFYIWAAGEHRKVDVTSRLGVHQSSVKGIPIPDGTLVGAKLLRRWSIPASITDAMLNTPPGEVYVLSGADLKRTASYCIGCSE